MEKKNNSNFPINVKGHNNVINVIINNVDKSVYGKPQNTGSKSNWLKTLGKLIRSLFVNIMVLFLEIFTKIG